MMMMEEKDQSFPVSELETISSRQNRKPILSVLGIIIFSLLVLVGFLVHQNYQLKRQVVNNKEAEDSNLSTSPTPEANTLSDWETYSNQKYGYSIKYPQAGTIFEVGESSDLPVDQWQATGIRLSFLEIQILAYKNKDNLSSQGYAEKEAPKLTLSNKKTTSVGGKLAYQYDYIDNRGNEQYPVRATTIISGDYAIVIIGIDRSGQADFTDYDSIISTSKFIGDEQADKTVNWKTYTNQEYGFQIIYPRYGEIQDPSCFEAGGKCGVNIKGECGSGIKEVNDAFPYIAIDNFFGIFPEVWSGTIIDYIKQKDPTGIANFSVVNVPTADEAVKIDYDTNKPGSLAYYIYIFKRGSTLFSVRGFQNSGNAAGCVTYDKSLNWDIAKSFSFTK